MDKYYLQLNGLAMGVPESPNLANLYGWYFENKANILADPLIVFYGQYIDVTTMSSPVNSDTWTPIFRPGLRHLLTLSIPPDLLRLVILLTILSYAPFTS